MSNDFEDFDWVPTQKLTDEEMEENIKYLQNHPLFAKSIDPLILQNNPDFEALQSLLYDDDPESLAAHFNVNTFELHQSIRKQETVTSKKGLIINTFYSKHTNAIPKALKHKRNTKI